MGYSLEAERKLMFYPTSEYETHRLLGLLGRIYIEYYQKEIIKNQVLGQEIYKQLEILSLDNNIIIDYIIYDYFLKNKMYKEIYSFCEISLGYPNNNPVVISDLFAGEGKWLDSFLSIIPRSKDSNLYELLANELEVNRFEEINKTENIKYKYNFSFEELQLPRNISSLMLFNPPYGSTNGIRNVKHYLQMIIDRKIIYNPNNIKDYKTGYMVFVIRKDDFLDSLDLIVKNFWVHKNCIYKVEKEEYAKYKQYIFIARLKNNPYNLNNIADAMDFQKEYNEIKNIIESEPEFKLKMYGNYMNMRYPYIDIKTSLENFQVINNNKINYSREDSAWKWIKEITELKDLGCEKLQIPKPFKYGELANIIASGYINGELSINNKGKHIVIGGTKNILKQKINTYKGEDGKKITETKVIKMSQPYLNILCSDQGKLKILELGETE